MKFLRFYFTKYFIYFFFVNLIVVTFILFSFIIFTDGKVDKFNIGLIALISIPIIIIQYPFLNLKDNLLYRTFIFYLSMLLFLFLLGIISAWNIPVGSNDAGTWLARFDAGLRLMFFGQLFGGFLGLGFVLIVNIILKKVFFKTNS